MRIGIIVALKREAKGYFEELSFEKILDEPFEVFKAQKDNKLIFLAVSGLGKSYSAACTQFLIDRFNIDLIVNTGSCGGVCPRFSTGDIVLPAAVIEYDFKSLKLGTPNLQANRKFLYLSEKYGIKMGILGSADSNVDTKDKKELLHRQGISVADWEGASILKTALKNRIDALILKVVTDTSSENFVSEFLQNVKIMNHNLAQKALEIITNYHP